MFAMDKTLIFKVFVVLNFASVPSAQQSRKARCAYSERGSLTTVCRNVLSVYFFRIHSYYLNDPVETVCCQDCNLGVIISHTFDINRNKITTLNLHNSRITGLQSWSFIGLIYLTNLILTRNEISKISPGIFKGIKNVNYLDLSQNVIFALERDSFAELEDLEELNLSYNKISHIYSGAFGRLSALKILNLESNKLTNLEDSFVGLKSIRTINLRDNSVKGLQPNQINGTEMLDLNLSENSITTLTPNCFTSLENLIRLDLSRNQIRNISVGAFRGLKSLEYLFLNNNTIPDLSPTTFIRLHNLRDLHLAHNTLTDAQLMLYATMPELRYLNLSHNRIQEVQRGNILKLYNLHSLDVSWNNIGYLDYKALFEHAPRLVLLNIDGNDIPCYIIEDILSYVKEDNILLRNDNSNNHYLMNNCTQNAFEEGSWSEMANLRALEKAEVKREQNSSRSGNFYAIYALLLLLTGMMCVIACFQYKTLAGIRSHSDISQSEDVRRETSFENCMSNLVS